MKNVMKHLEFLIFISLIHGISMEKTAPIVAVACEEQIFIANCHSGQVIRILSAMFGRFSLLPCKNDLEDLSLEDVDLQCMSKNSTSIVKRRCENYPSCMLKASRDVFGDPCYGTPKYLEIQYFCDSEKSVPIYNIVDDYEYVEPGSITGIDSNALKPTSTLGNISQTQNTQFISTTLKTLDTKIGTGELKNDSLTNFSLTTVTDINFSDFVSNSATINPTLIGNNEVVSNVNSITFDNDTTLHHIDSMDKSFTPDNLTILKETPLTNNEIYLTSPTILVNAERQTQLTEQSGTPQGYDKAIFETSTLQDNEIILQEQSQNHSIIYDTIQPDSLNNETLLIQKVSSLALYCLNVMSRSILWPSTPLGISIQQKCPNNAIGFAQWFCGSDGHWFPRFPDLSGCSSQWSIDLENKYHRKNMSDIRFALAYEISQNTNGKDLLGGDLKRIVKLIKHLAIDGLKYNHTNTTLERNFTHDLINASNSLLSTAKWRTWNDFSTADRWRIGSSFLSGLDNIANMISYQYNSTEATSPTKISKIIANYPYIVIKSATINLKSSHERTITFSDVETQNVSRRSHEQIEFLPPTKINNADTIQSSHNYIITLLSGSILGVLAKSPENALSEDKYHSKAYNKRSDFPAKTHKLSKDKVPRLGTKIISIISSPTGISHLPKNNYNNNNNYTLSNQHLHQSYVPLKQAIVRLKFYIQHFNPIPMSTQSLNSSFIPTEESQIVFPSWMPRNPKCVFFNFYGRSDWSSDGCWVSSFDKSKGVVTCDCNHLTNFAVLFDVVGFEIPIEHDTMLSIITYVGCIISAVCLLMAFITFQYLRNLMNERMIIHKHLCLNLFIAEMIFLFGIQATSHKIGCAIVAASLHYFFLVAFLWMLIEGIQLYTMLVEVFESEKSKIKPYIYFAYGIPCLIVGISAAIFPRGYGTNKYCWLSSQRYFIFSFIGPVTMILVANFVFLCIALYIMGRHFQRMPYHQDKSRISLIRTWLKGAVVLIFLMGLTWLFGLLNLDGKNLAFAYLFTILNSFQGLFIFVFHCVMNDKVLKEYKRLFMRSSLMPGWIKSYVCMQHSGTTTSSNKLIERLITLSSGGSSSSNPNLGNGINIINNKNFNKTLNANINGGNNNAHSLNLKGGKNTLYTKTANDKVLLQSSNHHASATLNKILESPSDVTDSARFQNGKSDYENTYRILRHHHHPISLDNSSKLQTSLNDSNFTDIHSLHNETQNGCVLNDTYNRYNCNTQLYDSQDARKRLKPGQTVTSPNYLHQNGKGAGSSRSKIKTQSNSRINKIINNCHQLRKKFLLLSTGNIGDKSRCHDDTQTGSILYIGCNGMTGDAPSTQTSLSRQETMKKVDYPSVPLNYDLANDHFTNNIVNNNNNNMNANRYKTNCFASPTNFKQYLDASYLTPDAKKNVNVTLPINNKNNLLPHFYENGYFEALNNGKLLFENIKNHPVSSNLNNHKSNSNRHSYINTPIISDTTENNYNNNMYKINSRSNNRLGSINPTNDQEHDLHGETVKSTEKSTQHYGDLLQYTSPQDTNSAYYNFERTICPKTNPQFMSVNKYEKNHLEKLNDSNSLPISFEPHDNYYGNSNGEYDYNINYHVDNIRNANYPVTNLDDDLTTTTSNTEDLDNDEKAFSLDDVHYNVNNNTNIVAIGKLRNSHTIPEGMSASSLHTSPYIHNKSNIHQTNHVENALHNGSINNPPFTEQNSNSILFSTSMLRRSFQRKKPPSAFVRRDTNGVLTTLSNPFVSEEETLPFLTPQKGIAVLPTNHNEFLKVDNTKKATSNGALKRKFWSSESFKS